MRERERDKEVMNQYSDDKQLIAVHQYRSNIVCSISDFIILLCFGSLPQLGYMKCLFFVYVFGILVCIGGCEIFSYRCVMCVW